MIAETAAFLPLDDHAALQDKEGLVVRLALAQQDIARPRFQDRRAGQDCSGEPPAGTDANSGR